VVYSAKKRFNAGMQAAAQRRELLIPTGQGFAVIIHNNLQSKGILLKAA
jgi:hypothetical protein